MKKSIASLLVAALSLVAATAFADELQVVQVTDSPVFDSQQAAADNVLKSVTNSPLTKVNEKLASSKLPSFVLTTLHKKTDREFGGAVIRKADGLYRYTDAVKGDDPDWVSFIVKLHDGETLAGIYHTNTHTGQVKVKDLSSQDGAASSQGIPSATRQVIVKISESSGEATATNSVQLFAAIN